MSWKPVSLIWIAGGLIGVGCGGDDAPYTWVAVGGVTELSLDAHGDFIAFQSTTIGGAGAPVQAGGDPTAAWGPIPGLDDVTRTRFLGVSTRQPTVLTRTQVLQSTEAGWVDQGKPAVPGAYESVLAVDRQARLVVSLGASGGVARYDQGTLEPIYTPPSPGIVNYVVSPAGDVFQIDPSRKAEEIYRLDNGVRTALLEGRGCSEPLADCARSARVIGWDAKDAMYVESIVAGDIYHRFYRYAEGAWTELPSPSQQSSGGGCWVTGAGALYCVHESLFLKPTDPLDSINLYRLRAGGEWSDLGVLPEHEYCHVVARDDDRVALTCSALGGPSGATNDSLWVSD